MNALEIQCVGDLLRYPGFEYLQVPKSQWVWKLRPFISYQVEPWAGYVESHVRSVRLPALFVSALLQAGWQRQELECYWRFIPPETNNG